MLKPSKRGNILNNENDVLILAGGKGTRLYPLAANIPKPMVKIGDLPVVEHIIRLFEYHGFRNIKLLVGYKKEVIEDYFEGRYGHLNLECIDTGEDSDTAERIWKVRNTISETFFLSYADVLADLDLKSMFEFHIKHNKIGTVATYSLTTSYGIIYFDEDNIAYKYVEKPVIPDYHINAGYFIFNSTLFDHWDWQSKDFSKGMLVKLSREQQLACYKHEGFWSGMDTVRENEILCHMWESGDAKWAVWREDG